MYILDQWYSLRLEDLKNTYQYVIILMIIWLYISGYIYIYMGVSENSVPLNPMVNDHYPY